MSIALLALLQLMRHVAVVNALHFEVERVVVQPNGGVAAYTTLQYLPKNSPLAILCPKRIEIPSWGLPWLDQSTLKVSGIPDRFREKNRVIVSPLVGYKMYSIRENDKLTGIVDVSSFFTRGFDKRFNANKNPLNLRISGVVHFYSYTAARQRSTVRLRLESKPAKLSIDQRQRKPK